jgi:uncharacterized membrane protein (DUF106 family)
MLISLVTTILNRKFIDREKMAEVQQEINKWNSLKNRAKKTGDKKLYAKAKRQEPHILQLQSRMFKQQMKTTAVTIVPFFILFSTLPGFFGPTVALAPWLGGEPYGLPFIYWYMICSFFISTVLRRITGVGPSMGMGLGMGENK